MKLWSVAEVSFASSNLRIYYAFYLFLLTAYHFQFSQSLDSGASVTINQYPGYDQQRHCGMGCLQNNYDGGADVEEVLGCTWNGCFCGTQYQAAVTSIVESCWTAYCGAAQSSLLPYDISTALSLYNAYCSNGVVAITTIIGGTTTGGYLLSFINTANFATVTMSGGINTVTADVITQSTFLVSASPSQESTSTISATPDPSQDGPNYSTSDKIALGVGLGLGIPTLIATIWACLNQLRKG